MYQSTAKQQQKFFICTGVFYAFEEEYRKKNPNRFKTIINAINFVNNH